MRLYVKFAQSKPMENSSSGLISFIIPAHNEAFEIGRTLTSVFNAARAMGRPFEVFVVNDASNDQTPEIARQAGARVVDVNRRQISAVRNAGAREAKGDLLFFVDADSQLPEATLRAAVAALERGAAGGGARVKFAEPLGWTVRVAMKIFSFFYMGVLGWAAGCFIFARRDAFEAARGFDETLFAGEEILLSIAMKRQGRFVLLHEPVTTSARKLRMYSTWRIIPLVLGFILHGSALLRSRKGLEWWYDGKREQ